MLKNNLFELIFGFFLTIVSFVLFIITFTVLTEPYVVFITICFGLTCLFGGIICFTTSDTKEDEEGTEEE